LRRSPVVLTLLLLAGMLAQPAALTAASATQSYVVLFTDSSVSADSTPSATRRGRVTRPQVDGRRVSIRIGALRRSEGFTVARRYSHAVGGFSARLSPAQAKRLASDPSVAAVMPDVVVRLDDDLTADEMAAAVQKSSSTQPCVAPYAPPPGAPCIPAGVKRVGATSNAAAAIDGIDERVDIDIGIIDTGIDSGHPDLNYAGGYNCTDEGGSANTTDRNGHGTHVAGTIGAIDNGSGVVGVAPGARLWSIKVLDRNGSGSVSWIICGIDWLTGRRDPADASRPLIEVANMSLRFKPGSQSVDTVFHKAIRESVAAGTVYAVAAGNESNNAQVYVPAAYPEVIAVGATVDYDGLPGGLAGSQPYSFCSANGDDRYAKFSSYGAVVDLAAPGKCVLSSWPRSMCSSSATTCYAWLSGTSMATPHVTGGAALYLAQYPEARPQQVRMALQYAGRRDWKTGTYPDSRSSPPRQMWTGNFSPPPDFSATIGQPANEWLSTSSGLAVPLTISRTNGHKAPVGLVVSGAPSGVRSGAGIGGNSGSVALTAQKGTPAGTYDVTLRTTDGELVRGSRTFTLKIDADVPTAAISSPPAGLTIQSSGTVSIAWTESDAASGIAGRSLQRQRAAIRTPGSCNGLSFANIGTPVTTAGPVTQSLKSGYCFRWRLTVRDLAGNSKTFLSGNVLIDTSAPAAPTYSLAGSRTGALVPGSLSIPPAAQVGSTIWFRGGVAGSLDVSIAGSDPQSGIAAAKVGPASPATGWQTWPATAAGSKPTVTLPFKSGAVSTSVSLRSVNGAGLTGPASVVHLKRDATAPSRASWSTPKPSTSRAGTSFKLSWSGGSDSGSGLSPKQWVRRLVAPANSAGTCKGVDYAVDGPPRMLPNGATETGLQPGNCYRWRLRTLDNVGNLTGTALSGIVLSGEAAPATVSQPTVELKPGAKVTARGLVRLMVSWSGGTSGARYGLRYSANGGASWSKLTLDDQRASSRLVKLPAGSYLFAVRATNAAGSWTSWVKSSPFTLQLRQAEAKATTYAGSWSTKTIAGTLGGRTRLSSQQGATATFAYTGRELAVVGLRKPKRGAAKIYIDGALVAKVDTRSTTTELRKIIFKRSGGTSAKHVLKVKVVGTSGRPRVDLDAFVVLSD
jgi:subtilisin